MRKTCKDSLYRFIIRDRGMKGYLSYITFEIARKYQYRRDIRFAYKIISKIIWPSKVNYMLRHGFFPEITKEHEANIIDKIYQRRKDAIFKLVSEMEENKYSGRNNIGVVPMGKRF